MVAILLLALYGSQSIFSTLSNPYKTLGCGTWKYGRGESRLTSPGIYITVS